MPNTFPGLKLQGEIGKFGQLEISDVTGFAESPDGKVLCGTESGSLILWEGNLVQGELTQKDGLFLHQGMINSVILEDKFVITTGADGCIKWWDFDEIDNAEADEIINVPIGDPRAAVTIEGRDKKPAHIVHMIRSENHWLVADGNGKLWKLNSGNLLFEEILHFHSGIIYDLALSPTTNAAITLGNDGIVRISLLYSNRVFR